MTMKKTTSLAIMAAISAVFAILIIGATSKYSSGVAQTSVPSVTAGLTLPPGKTIYALTSDNAIYSLAPGATQYTRLGRVSNTNGGNLIGIGFRVPDKTPTKRNGLTDTVRLFNVDVSTANFGATALVSTVSPRLTSGFGTLMDFNPVVNALRLIGSNGQNIAVVNAATGGNLNQTAVQTSLAYAQGDVNFGKAPQITGGAYNNNFVGATATLFYMVDHDLDTLVTISTKSSTGSSNTGGGQLQTIGSFVDAAGTPLNMSPTTDFDICTVNGVNYLVGQTTRLLFSINLAQINPNLPLGTTQKVVVARGPAAPLPGPTAPLTGGVFDIAVQP